MRPAPIGSAPPPIDMDGLATGIELDISGIGDERWPPAATADDEWPEPHAAASSTSAPTPTAPRTTEPGRERPRDEDLDMNRTPPAPAPGQDAITAGVEGARIHT